MKTVKQLYEQNIGKFPETPIEVTEKVKRIISQAPNSDNDKDFYAGVLSGCYEDGAHCALAMCVLFEDNGVETETLRKAMRIAYGRLNESNG